MTMLTFGLGASVQSIYDLSAVTLALIEKERSCMLNYSDIYSTPKFRFVTIENITMRIPAFWRIVKGDAIQWNFPVTFQGAEVLADYSIRAELWDDSGHSIKLATVDVGGNIGDIVIVDSTFSLFIGANLTTDFDSVAKIEIELTSQTGKKLTILPASEVTFLPERITSTWTP